MKLAKQIKKAPVKPNTFVWDTETTFHREFNENEIAKYTANESDIPIDYLAPFDKSRVFLSGLMNCDDEQYWLNYENLDKTLDTIVYDTIDRQKKRALVFVHNLKYDGSYLIKHLTAKGYTQTLKTMFYGYPKINYREFYATISDGKWFNIFVRWKTVMIEFRCSLKLIPMSLEKIAKTFKLKHKKNTVDYKQFRIIKSHKYPQEWLDYLYYDCWDLKKAIELLSKEDKNFLSKPSIGGVAFTKVSKTTKKYNNAFFNVNDYRYWNQWYYGGISTGNKYLQGKWVVGKDNIRCIDAKSMYPSQFDWLPFYPAYFDPKTKKTIKWDLERKTYDTQYLSKFLISNPNYLPNKKRLEKQGLYNPKFFTLAELNEKGLIKYVDFLTIKINKAQIRKKYSEFEILRTPSKHNLETGKIFKPKQYTNQSFLDKFEIQEMGNEISYWYYTAQEFELIKKFYKLDYEIIKTETFPMSKYLDEPIQVLYKSKFEAKEQNNAGAELLSKLILNNIYGKFGQSPDFTYTLYGEWDEEYEDEYELVGEKRDKFDGLGITVRKKYDPELTKARPVFIAAYITSSARCSLISKYLELSTAGVTWLYCDTDSLIFYDDKKIQIKNIGNWLKQWDEVTFKYPHVNATKTTDKTTTDAFIYLCSKQYRTSYFKQKYASKSANAGVPSKLMLKVLNKDYNYDLKFTTKNVLELGEYGFQIIDTGEFNFEKYKGVIKNPKLPKELEM